MSEVVTEMRERLLTNRSGKLTSNQWLDIVTQPFIGLLVFFVPLSFILLPRMVAVFMRGGWLAFLVAFVILAASALFRAFRYARLPIHVGEFTATAQSASMWTMWRPLKLKDSEGQVVRFRRRLAPRPLLQEDKRYLVYYLRDHDDWVLLSLVGLDHPKINQYQPDSVFQTRFKQRSRSSTRKVAE